MPDKQFKFSSKHSNRLSIKSPCLTDLDAKMLKICGNEVQSKTSISHCIMVKPYIKGCRCATILDRTWLEGLQDATIQNSGTLATFDLPLT